MIMKFTDVFISYPLRRYRNTTNPALIFDFISIPTVSEDPKVL